MIFVTVGTQLAFDRMVSAVDRWAAAQPGVNVFAQVGPARERPQHIPHADFLTPARANSLMRQAALIVAHAGMGTVLTALELRKPIVIMPRLASLGEHRNEHQMATARWLQGRPGVHVAWNEAGLLDLLDRRDTLPGGEVFSSVASGPLVDKLRAVVQDTLKGRR
ncbi:MAG: glycosyl transferase family 28 [Burkholderiales bacterium]|nr:glycosyl transferase family 28 [Burkholderiales bacterium]